MSEYINGKVPPFYQSLYYAPGLADSADVETGTTAIVATSKPAWADCQYKGSTHAALLTFGPAAPSDSRLTVRTLGIRLLTTIDSYDTATALSYVVYRNEVQMATASVATGSSTGAKITAASVTTGTLTGATEWRVGYWVNQATSATLSVVNLQVGVGCNADAGWGEVGVSLAHTGWVKLMGIAGSAGSGTQSPSIMRSLNENQYDRLANVSAVASGVSFGLHTGLCIPYFVDGTWALRLAEGTATDLLYVNQIGLLLRVE